eukprot:gene778-829_t
MKGIRIVCLSLILLAVQELVLSYRMIKEISAGRNQNRQANSILSKRLSQLFTANSGVPVESSTKQNPFDFNNFVQSLLGSLNTMQGLQGSSKKQNLERITTEALVIGSGISGSTAAFYLNKNGVDVILAESRDVVGGNLISKRANGFLWEEGPNSFQPNPAILRLAKDIGMIDELVLADPTLPRYVYWEGNLFALPSGPADLLNFNLLTWPGKIRAGLGAIGLHAPKPAEEETVKQFVVRHLGEETFERVIDPFVSGVYAGNPMKLSMGAALKKVKNLEDLATITGGFIEGAIRRINQLSKERKENAERDADLPKIPGGSLGTFKNGLQSIPLKIQNILGDKVKLSYKLIELSKDSVNNQWIATFETKDGQKKQIASKSILLTSPAYATAEILRKSDPTFLPEYQELAKIYYPPVASVTTAYPNSAFKEPLRGFGHLIPRAMKVRTLGTIWSSSLFPGRAPEGYTMLLNYIGGSQDPEIANLTPEQIVEQVHQDNKKVLLKDDAPKPKVLGVRVWPRAIPQYELGHLKLMEKVENAVKQEKGLFIGGNFRSGVAFGDCVQYGADVAKELTSFVKSE